MSFTGTIENGVVKLPSGLGLPDGTQVRVEPIIKPDAGNELTRRLAEIASNVSNLPTDFAAKHDHYVHGTSHQAQQPKPPSDWQFPQGRRLGAFQAPVEDWRLLANEAAA